VPKNKLESIRVICNYAQ